MKIPNSDHAIIEQSKITGYLLNIKHERGGSKAKKLIRFGYSLNNWQQLELDIRKFHLPENISMVRETSYGVRYEVRAALLAPLGEALPVKTVWQIDAGTEIPRLITLVPD